MKFLVGEDLKIYRYWKVFYVIGSLINFMVVNNGKGWCGRGGEGGEVLKCVYWIVGWFL